MGFASGMIRVLALGVLVRTGASGKEILASQGEDPAKGQVFHRLLGGGIDFGEHSREALAREFREELGAEIEVGDLYGWEENIFHYRGKAGHELMAVYAVRFVDEALYSREEFTIADKPEMKAVWVPVGAVRRGEMVLYPEHVERFVDED